VSTPDTQTLAFALRKDMDWMMTGIYWVVQVVGAARVLRGPAKAQEAAAAQGTPLDRTA